ncbi:MAG: hypothetical protein GXN93_04840 [Candidatus Diapherotrites archaeon]|nr:hypothetical protein [Candidatus Diapherotrites archaeon]
MRRNIYLETRGVGAVEGGVPDVGKRGLSSTSEVVGIVFSILKDYALGTTRNHSGRQIQMTYRLASQRLQALKNIILPRDPSFKGAKLRRAKRVVSTGLVILKRYKGRRSQLASDLPRILRRLNRVAERG